MGEKHFTCLHKQSNRLNKLAMSGDFHAHKFPRNIKRCGRVMAGFYLRTFFGGRKLGSFGFLGEASPLPPNG